VKLKQANARVAMVSSEAPRVEDLIEKFKALVNTPWILRIDDDECPSRELVEWIMASGCDFDQESVSFPRRWLRFSSANKLEFAASASWDQKGEDRQFRLYCKDTVNYINDIHTPGFLMSGFVQAPSNAVIYHFDWIIRSKSERLAKVAKYDAQRSGMGSSFVKYYIPEDFTNWDYGGAIVDANVQVLARHLRRIAN
jgi:hypothetical protein